jgi:hypothetical protein
MTKLGSLVLFGALLVPQTVFAQDRFGSAGQFAISADRLTGVSHTSIKTEQGEVTSTQSMTTITLFTNTLEGRTSAYSYPRLGADYFVIDSLSIGAALGIVHSSSSNEIEQGNNSLETDGPSQTGFLIYPRVGYALMFQDNFGFWPRGGLTYASASSTQEANDEDEDDSETSQSALAFSLEALFVFSPVPHVAFTGGPTLDLGLSGSYENDPGGPAPTNEFDIKATDIGLQLGITAFF